MPVEASYVVARTLKALVVLNSDSLVLSVDLEHPRKENTR